MKTHACKDPNTGVLYYWDCLWSLLVLKRAKSSAGLMREGRNIYFEGARRCRFHWIFLKFGVRDEYGKVQYTPYIWLWPTLVVSKRRQIQLVGESIFMQTSTRQTHTSLRILNRAIRSVLWSSAIGWDLGSTVFSSYLPIGNSCFFLFAYLRLLFLLICLFATVVSSHLLTCGCCLF